MASHVVSSRRTSFALITSSLLALQLGACGGGGGDDGGVASEPAADDVVPSGTPNDTDPGTPDVDSTSDVDGPALYRGSLNSAVLQGPVIGDGSVPNADVIRALDLEAQDLGNGLVLRELYAVEGVAGVLSNLLGVVENTSERMQCVTGVQGSELLDRDGVVLERQNFGLEVSGSIGVVEDPGDLLDVLYFEECIRPGTIAYAFGGLTNVEEVGGARIDGLSVRDENVVPDDRGTIVPVSYSVTDSGDIDVLVANRGDRLTSAGGVDLILLDADGSPLAILPGFGFQQLEPGEEAIESVAGYDFAGQASTVRAVARYSRTNYEP